jgi:hypothetical protein
MFLKRWLPKRQRPNIAVEAFKTRRGFPRRLAGEEVLTNWPVPVYLTTPEVMGKNEACRVSGWSS